MVLAMGRNYTELWPLMYLLKVDPGSYEPLGQQGLRQLWAKNLPVWKIEEI